MHDLFKNYPDHVLKKFKTFHTENPHIFNIFKEKSIKMYKTGKKKYAARTIFEVMRWEHDLKTSGDPFKINNDYIPIYKRLLVYQYPEMTNFYEFRAVRSLGVSSMEEKKRNDNKLN